MKKLTTILTILMIVLAGCGGGGGGTGISRVATGGDNAPSISNLSISPSMINYNAGGGAVTVRGTFDFIDMDGDLMWITYYNVDNPNVQETSRLDSNVTGVAGGTIAFSVMGSSTQKGTFTYKMYVTDSKHNNSNGLTATVTVR